MLRGVRRSSSVLLVVGASVFVFAITPACGEKCVLEENQYDCQCKATCRGQNVSVGLTPCAVDSAQAASRAGTQCTDALTDCPEVDRCTCTCTDTGTNCPPRQCG